MNEWEAQLQQRKRRRMFSSMFHVLHFLVSLRLRSFIFFGPFRLKALRILYTLEFSIPINPLRDLVHKRVHS